jgi:guanosine-3',5'-bis(diphosphate) 3'-pyrophosphohydrolase
MAALMHDAMEDCGITKTELIERFGAPRPTWSTA